MILVKPPQFITRLFSYLTWSVPNNENKIFLTFDDGPVPETTPKVLELLDNYNIKATFFCIADNVQKYPELFEELKKKGHAYGNHTFNHLKGWKVTNKHYFENTEKAHELIQSPLFRPPYGRLKPSQAHYLIQKKNYKIFMWNVLSRDYNPHVSPDACLKNVKKYTSTGSIIVFHDSIKASKNMFYALPKSIEYLKEKGFVFDVLKVQTQTAINLPKSE